MIDWNNADDPSIATLAVMFMSLAHERLASGQSDKARVLAERINTALADVEHRLRLGLTFDIGPGRQG